jgi:hypothetical protein
MIAEAVAAATDALDEALAASGSLIGSLDGCDEPSDGLTQGGNGL